MRNHCTIRRRKRVKKTKENGLSFMIQELDNTMKRKRNLINSEINDRKHDLFKVIFKHKFFDYENIYCCILLSKNKQFYVSYLNDEENIFNCFKDKDLYLKIYDSHTYQISNYNVPILINTFFCQIDTKYTN